MYVLLFNRLYFNNKTTTTQSGQYSNVEQLKSCLFHIFNIRYKKNRYPNRLVKY